MATVRFDHFTLTLVVRRPEPNDSMELLSFLDMRVDAGDFTHYAIERVSEYDSDVITITGNHSTAAKNTLIDIFARIHRFIEHGSLP